ncbi:MAG: hypothetical protein K0S78_3181, partial [Thermomicrobiales bacterium]|nr:hypothetical protein [Thermomicrobiales bacterium]
MEFMRRARKTLAMVALVPVLLAAGVVSGTAQEAT